MGGVKKSRFKQIQMMNYALEQRQSREKQFINSKLKEKRESQESL